MFSGPQNYYTVVNLIQGTRPYLPEEFLRNGIFSTKLDTYSFGVVLFEIATSRLPYSKKKGNLKDTVVEYEGDVLDLKDKRLEGYDSTFKDIMCIGKMCVKKLLKERPKMEDALLLLEKISLQS